MSVDIETLIEKLEPLTIDGADYEVVPIGPRHIRLAQEFKKEMDGGKFNVEQLMERYLEMVKSLLPTAPEELIRNFSIPYLNAVIEYAGGSHRRVREERKNGEPDTQAA